MKGDWPAPDHVRAAAQLDATMRMLTALDDLQRDVDALRREVRPRGAPLPIGTIVRVAAEAAILIAVAVLAGAGQFRPVVTVALMGLTLVAVTGSEWLASRSAYVPRSFGFAQARAFEMVDPPAEAPLESDAWERALFPETEPARL
jgi:hypothetical protein